MLSTIPSTAYGWLMLAGIFVSIFLWSQMIKRDDRLVLVYVAALAGAFLGAKLVYLGAEGWLHWHDPDRWVILATGKSITGALLGGYAAVEIAKRLLKYNGVTGDWFAIIVPAGVMIGRIGCMINGCCLGKVCTASWFTINDMNGVPRWPSSQMEFVFNAVMLGDFDAALGPDCAGTIVSHLPDGLRHLSFLPRISPRHAANRRANFGLSNRRARHPRPRCRRFCATPAIDAQTGLTRDILICSTTHLNPLTSWAV